MTKVRFKPLCMESNLSGVWTLWELKYGMNASLKLTFVDIEEKKIEPTVLTFQEPLYFNLVDEGDRLESFHLIDGLGQCTVFVSDESTLLKWFTNERGGINIDRLRHFVVLSDEEWIDVLAFEPPTLKTSDLTNFDFASTE